MGACRIWKSTVTMTTVLSVAVFLVAASDAWAATEIEEIVVTATKREELLRDAPLAITVLSQKTIEDGGVRDIFGIAQLVPSLDVAQSTGPLSTSWFIRRIGNLGNIPNFESAVGVFVDGAFRGRPGTAVGDLFDVKQIEIVRGPQSTLHGKNTTAGLISIATNPPGEEFEMLGKLTTGAIDAIETADLSRLEGIVNASLSPALSLRAGGVLYRHDETLLNLFNGDHSQDERRYTIRGQLHYAENENFEARLIANRFRVDSAKMGDLVLFEGSAIQGINAAFGVSCPERDIDARLFCRNDASVFDLTSNDLTLNVRGNVGRISFTSISSYEDYESNRDFDADQLNIDVVRIIDRQRGSSFSQEVRISGDGDANPAWLVGAFFLASEFGRGSASQPTAILGPDAPNLELLPGLPVGNTGNQGFFDSASDSKYASVFGSINWVLSEAFSVRAGLRWQAEDKRTNIVNTVDHTGPTAITLQLMPSFADASLSRDTTGASWEVTGQYRWSELVMGYLLASRGFKSGGFNAGFGATPSTSREFDDEEVDNVELGIKSVLMDGRLQLNAALFAARYRNFQSAGWVSLRFLVNNAERVDVQGLELDVRAAVSDRFTAGTSLSWVDARYDRYTNGGCYFNRLPDNADGTGCDLSGHALPLAPRTRLNVDLAYEQPLNESSLYGRLDWSWSSRYYTNSTLDPRHVQASYSVLNGQIGYRFGRWEISAWIHNAADELVVMREGPSNLFSRDPAYARAFAMPRTFGVTVSARL